MEMSQYLVRRLKVLIFLDVKQSDDVFKDCYALREWTDLRLKERIRKRPTGKKNSNY